MSKSSLKKADTVLNIKNDTIKMFGQNIPIESSFNGHYSISILPEITSNFDDIEQVLIFEESETVEEKRKKLTKLHKQFGHASGNNLLNLIKNAGLDTKNISKIVEEITKQCNICKLYKKPLPRPAVSIPKSLSFNEIVAMNSVIICGICIL